MAARSSSSPSLVAALAAGGGSGPLSLYDNFVDDNEVGHIEDPRERLSSAATTVASHSGRVASTRSTKAPARKGRGPTPFNRAQHRPYAFTVVDAHSIYVEVMGELGHRRLLLIAGTLVAMFVASTGAARRARPHRHVYGAAIGDAAVWTIHAGVDWDWQMPAITAWLFALAGLGLCAPSAGSPARVLVRPRSAGARHRRRASASACWRSRRSCWRSHRRGWKTR